MAEFVMRDLVQKARLASQFHIESAATSREEIGNPVYPPARRKLAEHGISCEGHAARQLTQRDYDAFDLLIGMDQENLWNIRRILLMKASTEKSIRKNFRQRATSLHISVKVRAGESILFVCVQEDML